MLVLLANLADSMVHDLNWSTLPPPPPPNEEEVKVWVSNDMPPSPPSALSHIITSRNKGQIVRSWCQQL